MRRFPGFARFALPLTFVASMAGVASADEGAELPPVSAPDDGDVVTSACDAPAFKHFTVTANPLSLAFSRLGANIAYLPVAHHALVINPFAQVPGFQTDGNGSTAWFTGFGAEVGYHYYTGTNGANGAYIGPSLIAMDAHGLASSATTTPQTSNGRASAILYGAALDVGGQYVTRGGFTVGAGVGVMYLGATDTSTSSTLKVSAVAPRVLFTIGYSF